MAYHIGEPKIEELTMKKTLIGKRQIMSSAANTTVDLWKSFMPQRQDIQHVIGPGLYSVQVYPPNFFTMFSPNASFEKWAAEEVSVAQAIPAGLDVMVLPTGLYAVFQYIAPLGSPFPLQAFLQGWLPASGYELDIRPIFEILSERYINHSEDSENEMWVPIKNKRN